MTSVAICDSPEAVRLARARWPSDIVLTDNPLLAHVSGSERVQNIDALVSQTEALELGRIALRVTRSIDTALAGSTLPQKHKLDADHLYLTGSVSRLVASLMHRASLLSRMLHKHNPSSVHIATIDVGRWEARNPLLMPRFANPARALAEQGFFAGRAWEYQAAATQLPKAVNETAARDVLRRALVLPPATIAHEIAQQIARRLKRKGSKAGHVIRVGESNEALREALPHLARMGFDLRPAKRMRGVGPLTDNSFGSTPETDADVSACLYGLLHSAFSKSGFFEAAETDALAKLVCLHVSAGLAQLSAQVDAMRRTIEEDFPQGGVLISNGLFGPAGAQAYHLYASCGVKVIEFEHGVTAGIAALTNTKLEDHGPPAADLHLVCSPLAVATFNGKGAETGKAVAIGLPDSVRRLQNGGLQRSLSRRALALGGTRPVVMHVSTLPYFGNVRPGLGAPSETTTFEIDKSLLTNVYPTLPHRVVFKQYPTQRFPFEPLYDRVFSLPPHVTVTKDEDFRYMRAAADVIVTMTPTSTLGWCVGTGVPIIWLASRIINPLADETVVADFDASFITVDIDRDGWAEQLRDTLTDIGKLSAQWQARRAVRQNLYARAIMGPNGTTGLNAARAIADFVEQTAVH